MPNADDQQAYYEATAERYDELHDDDPEHILALALLTGYIDYFEFDSVLDVGCGTGRAIGRLKAARPSLRVLGIEPVDALREVAMRKGLTSDDIVAGSAYELAQYHGQFDVVVAFAVMHHVAEPRRAMHEMLRCAKRGLFISDMNNFGAGSPRARIAKQALHTAHLWPLADKIKTRGKGYRESEGDGISYSYSLFDDIPYLEAQCAEVHLTNTSPAGASNPYRGAEQVAVMAVK